MLSNLRSKIMTGQSIWHWITMRAFWLCLFYLKNVRGQRFIMEHHRPNCNSNVTAPVVISQVLPHFTRKACQARCCSPKAGYWGKGSNNIPFSPQNELFFLVRSCKRLQGSEGLHSKSIKKGGIPPTQNHTEERQKRQEGKSSIFIL